MAREIRTDLMIADFGTWLKGWLDRIEKRVRRDPEVSPMEEAFRAGWERGWERCLDEVDHGDSPDY